MLSNADYPKGSPYKMIGSVPKIKSQFAMDVYGDIMQAFSRGMIGWDDIKFNKKVVQYLIDNEELLG